MNKTILITGCSTGIGRACALGMQERGWQVFATARKTADLEDLHAKGLKTVYLDYSEPDSISECANQVLELTGGRLDVLFNNGAYGQPGAVEDLRPDVLRQQFEVNLFGWHDLTCRIIPAMRAQGHGRIIQCSSVLGLVGLRFRGAYVASKFALEGLSDCMRLELRDSNISVSLIEPGPIETRFTAAAVEAFDANVDAKNSVFAEVYEKRRKHLEKGGATRFKLGPEAVLKRLIHAAESQNPKARYAVTTPTYLMDGLRRLLPTRLLDIVADRVSD